MNDMPQPYVALWVEGFRTFRRHMQGWMPIAIYFFIPLTAIYYYMLTEMAPFNSAFIDNMIDGFKHAGDAAYLKAHMAALKEQEHPGWRARCATIAAGLISFVQVYFYYGYFMRREQVVGDFKQNIGGLFYFLWKSLLTILLVAVLMIAIGLAVVLGFGILAVAGHFWHVPEGVLALLVPPAVIIMMIAMLYLSFRYSLAFALASVRVQAPIDASAALTRGNILRLLGNTIVMIIICLPFGILMMAISFGFGKFAGDDKVAAAVLTACYVALSIIFSGLFSAFRIAICRILYREKQAADSSFVLDVNRG